MHLGRVVADADAIGNVMCRDLLNWLEFLVLKWVYTCVHISGSGALQGSNDYYFGFASCLLDNFKETWDFVYEILWTAAMISNDLDCFPEKSYYCADITGTATFAGCHCVLFRNNLNVLEWHQCQLAYDLDGFVIVWEYSTNSFSCE